LRWPSQSLLARPSLAGHWGCVTARASRGDGLGLDPVGDALDLSLPAAGGPELQERGEQTLRARTSAPAASAAPRTARARCRLPRRAASRRRNANASGSNVRSKKRPSQRSGRIAARAAAPSRHAGLPSPRRPRWTPSPRSESLPVWPYAQSRSRLLSKKTVTSPASRVDVAVARRAAHARATGGTRCRGTPSGRAAWKPTGIPGGRRRRPGSARTRWGGGPRTTLRAPAPNVPVGERGRVRGSASA
jgi:hypothetical protein